MKHKELLNKAELESSPVVANCCMNRERDLRGSNGYEVELGFDPLEWLQKRSAKQSTVRWLDLCCGSGKALTQAAAMFGMADASRPSYDCLSVHLTGVDLVDMFLPHNAGCLQLLQCSAFDYAPTETFDLITCVHGLHYLGDKLRAIALAASWLATDGLFVANLEVRNLCLSEPGKGHRAITRTIREAGFEFDTRRHLLRRIGYTDWKSPFKYLGADDSAGPNYTKQPVVNSYYEQ